MREAIEQNISARSNPPHRRKRRGSISLKIKMVNGEKVRRKHTVFCAGGHDKVYPWIPRGQIWLERMRNSRTHRFTFAHEMIEYLLMRFRKMSYTRAHNIANKLEGTLRQGGNVTTTFKRYLDRHFPRNQEAWRHALAAKISAIYRRL